MVYMHRLFCSLLFILITLCLLYHHSVIHIYGSRSWINLLWTSGLVFLTLNGKGFEGSGVVIGLLI